MDNDNRKVYSDGDVEKFIIDYLVKNNKYSEEIINHSDNGAVFHNFTSVRENIINWYKFKKDSTVLEIGAGMGALTNFLCRKCKKVVSIEQSERRAEIIKLRCKENKNLTVLSGDICEVSINEKFDYILLIGVLEYAGIGKNDSNSHINMLKNALKFLKEDGKVLIAIENRFGLKYWCGAAEDHTGIPFDGISGYIDGGKTSRYNLEGVKTFSKAQLNMFLDKVGLKYKRYYYPLPDYKFPSVIYSEDKIPTEEEIQSVKLTYPIESTLIANEKLLYNEIIKNNSFDFFANSFFIEASMQRLEKEHVIFASNKRDYKNKYRVLTTIDSEEKVSKVPLSIEANKHLEESHNNLILLSENGIKTVKGQSKEGIYEYDFIRYKRSDEVFRQFLLDNNFESVIELIDKLKMNNLLSSKQNEKQENIISKKLNIQDKIDYGIILKNGYIDLTFVNSFYIDNELYFFDQEWVLSNIPLNFILFRAIKTAYGIENFDISIESLFEYIGLNNQLISIYEKFEDMMLSEMMDSKRCEVFDKNMYNITLTLKEKENLKLEGKNLHIQQLIESERYLNGELNNKNLHIELLLKSERELRNEVTNSKNKIEELNDENKKLKVEAKNKEGHIELLLESERELERIKSSRSWRYMTYIWSFRDIILPNESKRRLLVKMSVKAIKHPIRFLKKCTPKRIRKFFYYLKREGVSNVSSRLDECVIGNNNEKLNLNITNINENKVYTVSDFEKIVFNKVENPKVSIIIPVYNQIHYTYACLKSILENTTDVRYEIIIADDCSTDITSKIEEFIKNINVIRSKENLRFLLNCNNAAKYAKGEYILFLNNDTQVQENWLDSLVSLIESDESIGMVGSKLVYPDGRLQEAGGIIWDDASGWNYGRLSNPKDSEYNYVKECDYISGAAMMIRHSLWKEIGGFDERFAPAYYEDTDLAFEVRKHGYKVMLQPTSVVVHFEGISNGTDINNGQKSYQVKNAEKFKEKWRNELVKQFVNGEDIFLAKDRSKNRKHILVVDHYVPHYDKDAGGKCTYMYLKLFVSLGMKVTFIGDNFYPHQPYTAELQQMGIEVLYGNYYYNNWRKWVEENGKYFNYVYLNRPHISEKYIDLIKKYTDAKIIYFGHDLHYLREYREYEITREKSKLKSSNEWKEKEFNLFKKADVIHVVGTYEQELLMEEFKGKPVRNIPVYIYDSVRNDINKNFNHRENIIFVGGFGHPPNSDAVMWFAEKIFPRILRKYPDLIWYIVGSKPPENIQKLACENIVVTGFISDEELAKLYEKSRIAVVPLRVGAGVKGKVIEAMYNQIPLVTTSIGAEGLSLEENAFIIADKEDEFADSVIELYEDFEKLGELSDNSIKFIKKHFTSEVAKKAILSDIYIEKI